MYYVEFIQRDRAMPVEVFRALADQASSWVDPTADRMVLARDPELATARGDALRHLLYLFERDQAVRLLRGA